MRVHVEEPDADELELVHISRTLREAKRVEALLEEQGIDYHVAPEPYRATLLFVIPTQRIGAFFYVRVEIASKARGLLAAAGHQIFEDE